MTAFPALQCSSDEDLTSSRSIIAFLCFVIEMHPSTRPLPSWDLELANGAVGSTGPQPMPVPESRSWWEATDRRSLVCLRPACVQPPQPLDRVRMRMHAKKCWVGFARRGTNLLHDCRYRASCQLRVLEKHNSSIVVHSMRFT